MKKIEIDAKGIYYKELNQSIKNYISEGYDYIILQNVLGQRYIGDGLNKPIKIDIFGIPGNDLAAFMDGPTITIYDNIQDGTANTMNSGEMIVHGNAADVLGYGMRGGEVYIKNKVGYRVGIHMKEYENKKPVLVIGETAGNFLGEYMAGGLILLLNINNEKYPTGEFLGTGMHGGIIYINGTIDEDYMGNEIKSLSINDSDKDIILPYIKKYCSYFKYDISNIDLSKFVKLIPESKRPYGSLYV